MANWIVTTSVGTTNPWIWTVQNGGAGATLLSTNRTNVAQLVYQNSDGTRTVLNGSGLTDNNGTITWQSLSSVVHQTSAGVTLETISGFDATISGPAPGNNYWGNGTLFGYFISGTDTLTGASGADHMDGGEGADVIRGGAGADLLGGLNRGNDIYVIGAGDWVPTTLVNGVRAWGDRIGDGAGSNTIRLENAGDLDIGYGAITGGNFDGSFVLQYFSGTSRVTIDSDTIRTMVLTGVVGSAGVDTFNITQASFWDYSGLTFSSWTPGQDVITIQTTRGVTGTTQNDTFLMVPDANGNGARGAGGDDTFVFSGASFTNVELDGGTGTNTIQLNSAILDDSTTDNRALTNIQRVVFNTGESTFGASAVQIASGTFPTIIGSAGVDHFVANGHNANVSAVTFQSWTNGTDTINVNGSGVLVGSQYNDTFRVTAPFGTATVNGGLGTDTAFFDRPSAQATWSRNGDGTWSVNTNVQVTLSNVEFLQFTDRTVRLPTTPPPSDFNNDGKSDLLLQGGGTVVEWFLSNGAYSGANTVASGLPAGWTVAGTGDFNGDRFSDLVLQGGATVVEWFLNASGQYVGGNVLTTSMPAGWHVVGTGDVNGDGVTDLVLQGGPNVVDWVLNASGGYQAGNVLATGLPANWQVVGVGDLNGDAIADVLLQGGSVVVDWLLNASGGYAGGNVLTSTLPAGWTVRALGDFNGDGTSDVALQGGNYVVDWIMQNGNVVGGHVVSSGLPAGWNVTGSGDYNGDGTSDLSLQGGGMVVDWLLSNGQYAGGHVLATNLPAGWNVVGKT